MRKAKWILATAAIMVMAVSGSVQAQTTWGVGALWDGGSFRPDITIPIKMASGFVLTPMLGFTNISYDDESNLAAGADQFFYDFEGTQIRLGLMAEKQSNPDGASPVFGGYAAFDIVSPDAEGVDGWSDLTIGGFFGGSVPVAEHFDLVGTAGLGVGLTGEKNLIVGKSTTIATQVFASLRWWVGAM